MPKSPAEIEKEMTAKKRELEKMEQELEKARAAEVDKVRKEVAAFAESKGYTIEFLFGKAGTSKAKAKSSGTKRPIGTPKYKAGGETMPGQRARRHPAFAEFVKGGKLDDKAIAKAGMINPEWAKENPSAAKAMGL